ncbi:MAG: hypothetical protein AABP62_08375 [Planctomycetota bacterium]
MPRRGVLSAERQDYSRGRLFVSCLFIAALLTTVAVHAEEASSESWPRARSFPATEAHQAAAADDKFVYAIANSVVAKYDRTTGDKIATNTGEKATHLNSGFVFEGRLYCAHSNYPKTPEQSEIMVLDPATMTLSRFKEFGNFGGSLTWAIRHAGHWWCNFARYGDDNGQTFLVQFDDQWKEIARWTYPAAVVKELRRSSLSGGIWHDGLLAVTGHDDSVLFRLRIPTAGKVLELVERQTIPFTGQGIAFDPLTRGLIGIDRSRQEIVFADRRPLSPQPRLPRGNLLLHRDWINETRFVTTLDDWQQRRAEIIRGAESVMGRLPGREKRCPLDMQLDEEVDCGSYVRRLVTYQSEPGSRVPAYLCIPKTALAAGARPHPAVLCLHGTDNTVGHGTVVGLGTRPNRQYAAELAERGYVTLAPNYPLLAKYQPDVNALGWQSGTLKAVWDNIRGLDLLETLPFVRKNSFGAIGHSLGGHNSVYTALFDNRIHAVVSSCGLDSYLDYYSGDEKNWHPEKGWCQTRYMLRLADYRGRLAEIPFDFHELIGALAPRHVLIIAPVKDHNFQAASVDRIAAAARPVFKLYGHDERLLIEHPDCEHDFPPEMRQLAYELFDRVLGS